MINTKALTVLMAADELDFRIYDALDCPICQNLVPEKVWVDTLFDLGFSSIFFHDLSNPTCCKLQKLGEVCKAGRTHPTKRVPSPPPHIYTRVIAGQ